MGGESLHCCYREQFAYALYAKFRQPKLYRMAENGDWERIPARCASHPKEAAFVHKYPPNDTPLHRILRPLSSSSTTSSSGCEENNSDVLDHMDDDTAVQQMLHWKMEAVIALINAYPSCVHVRDSFGRNPLHLACMDMKGGGDVAAQYLLNLATTSMNSNAKSNSNNKKNDKNSTTTTPGLYHGDTAAATTSTHQQQDDASSTTATTTTSSSSSLSCLACVMDVVEKRTPLHYLVARNANVPISVLDAVVLQYPQAMHMKDVTGETPLDILRRRQDEIQNVDELLTKFNSYS